MTKTRDLANLIADSKVGPSEIDTAGTYNMNALQVGGTTVIDSSREGTLQRLNVTAATGLSSIATTTNAFTIGSTNDYNMAFDPNEIQARNNGAANDLVLQKNGGSVGIQTTAPATMLQVGDAGGTSTSRQRSIRLSHQTGSSSEYGGIEFYRAHQNSQKIGAAIIHQRPGTALDDSNLLFKTSTANQNATTRMTLTHDGKLGIGASDTEGFQMRVLGAIKLGTSGVTLGSTMLTGNYADGQEGWNIGSEYSTAAIQLMYGVKPSTTAENTYISSVDNANWKRSVLKTGEHLSFQTAGAQNTSVGTAVALTERFSVLADGRTTITSTGSPVLQANSSADSARMIIANTTGTSTFSYLELSTSSYGSGYLIKNIANSGNGLNNGSLYLWNSDSGGSGAIEFVPNQTIANRTTVEENGDLSVRGNVCINTTSITTAPLNIQCDTSARAIRIVGRSDDYGEIDFFENDDSTQLVRHQAHNTYYQIRTYAIPLKLATNGTDRFIIDVDGRKIMNGAATWSGITNGTSSGSAFNIAGDFYSSRATSSNSLHVRWYNTNGNVGNIATSGSGTTYSTTSDIRLKDNIEPIVDGTEKLMAMKPVTHTWIADREADAVHGFIAQDMQALVPEAVSGDPDSDEMMSMDYGRITPVLVAALQDAHKKIEALEERLAKLEAK